MRVLGIDPGSRIMGYGVVDKNGPSLLHVENGCLTARPRDSVPLRLEEIYRGLLEVLDKFRPDVVAIEEAFFAKNVASSLRLGESRGIALLAATQKKIPIFEYATREVKQATTGFGQATKEQVQEMVRRILKLKEVAQVDASDALAVAICHSNSARLKELVA